MKHKIFFIITALLLVSARVPAQFLSTVQPKPAEQTILLSTGVTMKYVEQGGTGTVPVIFLHGYTDSWHSFEPVLPYLPETIHVFALTQRGHGHSSKNHDRFHMEDFAADVAAFIRQKGLGKAIIAGHSMGGVVAQQFALDYPELTLGVVIISSAPVFHDKPGVMEFRKEVFSLADPISYAFAEGFQKSTIENAIDPAWLDLFTRESLKLPARLWKEVMTGILSVDFTQKLSTLEQPVLVIWGSKDMICFRSDQDKLVSGISQAKLLVYEGTGHALHWENPERFAGDISRFAWSFTYRVNTVTGEYAD